MIGKKRNLCKISSSLWKKVEESHETGVGSHISVTFPLKKQSTGKRKREEEGKDEREKKAEQSEGDEERKDKGKEERRIEG